MMTISKRALPRRARPRGARVPSSLALSGMLKVFGHQGALELVAQQKFIANYDLSNVECCARRQGLVQCLEQRLRVRSRRGAVCFFEQLRVRIGYALASQGVSRFHVVMMLVRRSGCAVRENSPRH